MAVIERAPAPKNGYWANFSCVTTDPHEPNNTREQATDVSETVRPFGLFLQSPSIFPAHDEDWFVIRDRAFSQISGSATKGLMDIYRDGELVAPDLAWNNTYMNTVPGPHTWEIRLRSTDGQPIVFPFSAST